MDHYNTMTYTTIPVAVTLDGRYELELLDAKTKNIIDSWSFSNILTDGGLNTIGSLQVGESFAFTYFQVGEGSTPVSSSDTGLVSPIAGRISASDEADVVVSGSDASGSYWQTTISRIFVEAEGNGNITEVGAFTLSSGGRLTTRALVRDNTNTPVTITKTSSNQLRLRYTIRMYVPQNDVTGSFLLGTGSYDYVIRPQGIMSSYVWGYGPALSGPTTNGGYFYEILRGQWNTSTLGAISSPSGTLVNPTGTISLGGSTSNCSSTTPTGYVDNTFYRDIDFVFNPSTGNHGTTGIRAMKIQPIARTNTNTIGGDAHYQMTFSPPIPKTNVNQFTLRLRFGWSRSKIYE